MGFMDIFSGLFSGASSGAGSALVSEPGFDWGSLGSGLLDFGKSAAVSAAPTLAGAAAGYGLNQLFPGTPAGAKLVDTRQGVTQQGANMALDRARNIQQNPTSFGLPGDVNDPNSPAGKKKYDIIQGSRSADAARSFNTGGSAQRETNALNTAVGNEYNKVWGDSMNTLQGQTPMAGYRTDAQPNPWGQMLAGAVDPMVSKGLKDLLSAWGMSA
jgi:hypothetical protein